VADLGKALIFFGAIIVVVGAIMLAASRANLPIGRLPGDIVYRGRNTSFYFPIVTCIVLSVVLSLVFWVIGRFQR
jgi:dipeptide/tripeptide permease